jgi:threonyl-tRNA synthetase
MLVVGDKEAAEGTVSVRARAGGDQGSSGLEEFLRATTSEVSRKAA